MPTACPCDDDLFAFAQGQLAAANLDQVRAHVSSCELCGTAVAEAARGLAGSELATVQEPRGAPAGSTESESTPELRTETLQPGELLGRYAILQMLGAGSMGAVYAAQDPELRRRVAIKVLRPDARVRTGPGEMQARLLREAQAMARLSHPNVVPVFEIGEVQGRLFLVMEMVEGRTLAKWLETPRPLDEVLEKFIDAGKGLAAAHAAGVVHRDFKPENVLVGKDGRARVTDFGLAREDLQGASGMARLLTPDPDSFESAFDSSGSGFPAFPSTLTPLGALLGTPAYMAPEQLRGHRADARSDLFAYCTALFEAIFGARPFPAKTLLAMLTRIEANTVAWPSGQRVPRWLRAVLARGLRADPSQRHESMDALLAEVRAGRSREERRWVWLWPALVILLVLAAGLVAALRRPKATPAARSMAVLAPRNASTKADSDWIAPALAEMIAGDLGGDAKVRLIPASEVTAAEGDLGLRGSALLAADLPRLRKRLGADLVLGGTYALSPDGKLTAELVLWDPMEKATPISAAGDEAHLIDLGARLGAEARQALGMGAQAPPGADAFPTNLEAARLYAEGLQLQRNYLPARAEVPLQKAAALSPDNPRIQLALAEVYGVTREEALARKAAQRAFELRGTLAPDEGTRAEILYRHTTGDVARAVALARASHLAEPDNLRRGLDLGEELKTAKQWKELLALTAELQRLPAPAGADARIDLLETFACHEDGDLKCAIAAAQRAYQKSQEQGARRQMSNALYWGGIAVRKAGDPQKAMGMWEEAKKIDDEIGNRSSAASSELMMATVFADRGELPRAREMFESALATYAETGDRAAEGAVLHNLAVLMRRARDFPSGLGYATRATTINLEMEKPGPAANSMTTLGNIRLDMGDISGAVEVLTRVCEMRRKAKSPLLVSALTSLATARLLQADFAGVRALLDEARGADGGQEKVLNGRVRTSAAQLALAEGRLEDASKEAALAAAVFKATANGDEEAMIEAVGADACLRRGLVAEARAVIDRAVVLMSASKSQIARTPVAVADARVLAAEHPKDVAEPLRRLSGLVAEAERTGARDDWWQARLAIAQIEQKAGRRGARDGLLALSRDALAQGFTLYAQEAAAAAAPTH